MYFQSCECVRHIDDEINKKNRKKRFANKMLMLFCKKMDAKKAVQNSCRIRHSIIQHFHLQTFSIETVFTGTILQLCLFSTRCAVRHMNNFNIILVYIFTLIIKFVIHTNTIPQRQTSSAGGKSSRWPQAVMTYSSLV